MTTRRDCERSVRTLKVARDGCPSRHTPRCIAIRGGQTSVDFPFGCRRWEFMAFPHEGADRLAEEASVKSLIAPTMGVQITCVAMRR